MNETELAVGDFRFRARTAGPPDGELVLLLHGFPQTSWEWREQVEALGAAGYRVVAPDQRGYSPGARPEGVEHYDVHILAGDVIAMADALGADRFHLVGHDWGGMVAWVVAIEHRARLESLTVISVPHPNAWARALDDPATDQAERSAYIPMLQTPGEGEALLGGDGSGVRDSLNAMGLLGHDIEDHVSVLMQPGALTAALSWYRAYDFHASDWGDIEVPTMYIWSSEDNACGRDAAVWTADYVRASYRFEVLEGVAHWVPELAPDDVTRLLLSHLRAHPAT
jgi:pimeloyl-ACP methyl ester carboxylesterase